MTLDVFTNFLRPEVKGVLAKDAAIFFATLAGLYRWQDGHMTAVSGWEGKPLRAIAKAQGGFLLVQGDRLVLCDKQAAPIRDLPPLPGDEAKSVLVDEKVVFAGGKTGIWRFGGESWEKVMGQKPYEVIGLGKSDGRLHAFVKKQGAEQRPALAISADGGNAWRHAYEGSYADLARAVAGTQIVTQWGGVQLLGATVPPQKEPTTAAFMSGGVVAKITGSKLELLHGGRVHLEIKAPILAEAETLLILGPQAVVAGVQGAFLVDLNGGAIQDMFHGVVVPANAGKIKKLFALDARRMLATASFGTFLSEDAGATWQPARSDWSVLDAVGVAADDQGHWWLAAQRGLFQSPDGGRSWKHAKVSGKPHGFAEFTGIAFAAGKLALATKAGLFISGPAGLKDLRAVPHLGRRLIEGVIADGDTFLATDGAGALYRVDPRREGAEELCRLAPKTVPLATTPEGLLLVAKQNLLLWRDGETQEVALPAPGLKDIHASGGKDQFLIWSGDRAWLRRGAGWMEMKDWPRSVKSVGMLRDGGVLVTDRNAIYGPKAA
jgi:hypothetical protein